MRNRLKERLEDATGIEKLRSSVRQDLFDEHHFLQHYPVAIEAPARISDLRLIDMAVAPPQTLRHKPSIDLVQAAQAARQSIWRGLSKMRSIDTLRPTKPAVDLMEAANFARKSRGEQPLPQHAEPMEPVAVAIGTDNSQTPRYTNFSSPTPSYSPSFSNLYGQARGGTPRAGSPVETTEVLNFSRPSSSRSNIKTLRRRSQSVEYPKPCIQYDNGQRPSTSGSNISNGSSSKSSRGPPTSYKALSPPPIPFTYEDNDDSESIAELASLFPLPAKTPPASIKSPCGSIRSRSASMKSPPPSIRSHSRKSTSTSVESSGSYTLPPTDFPLLEIFKPNGDLHDRYKSQTQDVEYVGAKYSTPVIHETIIPKVHNVITTEVTRHHHTHEIRQHVQPIIDRQYEAEKHWVQTIDGGFVQVTAEAAERLKSRYRYTTRVEETIPSAKANSPPTCSYTWKPPRDSRSRARGHTA
ncbi:hypothetical protein TWF569_003710 [Orbilia oligospora]|uniref:Uncharacterized protein n=1 Tax=Orbilia oligospora TaxID=2813651 RepID=A0A7C8K2X2_ORBOL|nr:hypothetical protein TWF102_008574 [Orbilia oligospora]KAF3095450.1 hypothetical protein TWF706_007969 [Orbilia oligospora]KAF3118218.1 hypothetical protein TWF103_000238 [Orbilia oligospora]KAF3130911.1 hypothetical protein TWF594_010192 [Orbilia oligospora]KAF3134432.1 hypothetical protein TWF703_006415 [Orbilia oligospora]